MTDQAPTVPAPENDLDALMKKVDLTDNEVNRIILKLREQRKSFQIEEASAKKSGRAVKSKSSKKPLPLSLEDLENIKL